MEADSEQPAQEQEEYDDVKPSDTENPVSENTADSAGDNIGDQQQTTVNDEPVTNTQVDEEQEAEQAVASDYAPEQVQANNDAGLAEERTEQDDSGQGDEGAVEHPVVEKDLEAEKSNEQNHQEVSPISEKSDKAEPEVMQASPAGDTAQSDRNQEERTDLVSGQAAEAREDTTASNVEAPQQNEILYESEPTQSQSQSQDQDQLAAGSIEQSGDYRVEPTLEQTSGSIRRTTIGDYRLEQPVVVKFSVDGALIDDLHFVLPLGTSVAQIKQQLALRVDAHSDSLRILFRNGELADDHMLAVTEASPHSELILEVRSSENKPIQLRTKTDSAEAQYASTSTVRALNRPRSSLNVLVKFDDGTSREVLTKIERHHVRKPNLGGLRDRDSGMVLNHAGTQTGLRPKPPPLAPLCSRDTQTVKIRSKVQQTFKDQDTQMTKIGVYVSNVTDKLVSPRRYETADEYMKRRERSAIVIQKWIRRWLAQRAVRKLVSDKEARLEWDREQELRRLREKEERQRRQFERRMNPKTKEDFDLLYSYLEAWRQEETAKINAKFANATRKAHLCKLLDQETQLLTHIERQKQNALRESRENSIKKLLSTAASPKKWYARDGKVTQMETPYNQRARELKDIYECVNMKYLTRDERLDVLLTLKHTVKEHDCELTREISELVDREADLLMRDVAEENLDGLRKRIATLFLQYIKTPMFNPEISRLLPVPQDPLQLRKNVFYCLSCNRYLPSTDFSLTSSSQTMGRCRGCIRLDNQARVRQDHSHFIHLLTQLRKTEQAYQDGSKIAFLMQENDLRYLIENIWGAQSILSAWPDLNDLVIVRWDKRDEWAPWNCILLTREEAVSHLKIEDIKLAYRKEFITRVQRRHTLAHAHFSRLPDMAKHMQLKETSKRPTVAGIGLTSA